MSKVACTVQRCPYPSIRFVGLRPYCGFHWEHGEACLDRRWAGSLHIYTGRASGVKPVRWARLIRLGICPICDAKNLLAWKHPEAETGTSYRCLSCYADIDWPGQWHRVERFRLRRSTPEATERLQKVLAYEDQCHAYENDGRDPKTGRFLAWPKWPFETESVAVV